MSDHGSLPNEDAQWSINSLVKEDSTASLDITMSDQFTFDPDTLSNGYDFPDFDPNTFPALDLQNIDMPNADCSWTFAPPPCTMNSGDLHDLGGTGVGNVYGSGFYDPPPYPQHQILNQQPISNGQVHLRGGDFVPNMLPTDSPLMLTMSTDHSQDSDSGMQYPSLSTGLTVPSTPQQFPKMDASFLISNVSEGTGCKDVADKSPGRVSTPELASPSPKDENKFPESRYVPILPKRGTPSAIEQSNSQPQTRKTTSNLKHTRAKDPPRRITTKNPQYQRNMKYTQHSYPSQDWGCFEYTEDGELDPARLYTASEMNTFLFSHPLGADLAIRIQRNPPRSRPRYPTNHSHRCRFADCPFYPNNTINQGHWAVAFDELTTSHPDHDPYIVAGYAHLWCLERFADFPKICAELNIHPDTRKMPKEHRGKNPMSLGTKAEEVCVVKFIQACRNGAVPESYPRFDMPDRPYEGTLTNRLACVKLRKEPKAVDGQRKARMKLAEYEGSNLRTHLGDLNKEVELRGMSRSHRNQNRLIVNVKHKRVFRGENFRDSEPEDEGDEGEGEGYECEDASEDEEDLENYGVPALKTMGDVGEMSTTARLRGGSIREARVAMPVQSQGKKRGADEAQIDKPQKKAKPTGDESEESDEEALKLEQQKIELELKLLALKRKEKAAKRAKGNVGTRE